MQERGGERRPLQNVFLVPSTGRKDALSFLRCFCLARKYNNRERKPFWSRHNTDRQTAHAFRSPRLSTRFRGIVVVFVLFKRRRFAVPWISSGAGPFFPLSLVSLPITYKPYMPPLLNWWQTYDRVAVADFRWGCLCWCKERRSCP